MKRTIAALAVGLFMAAASHAAVFLNEVFLNPPDGYDSSREFIELQGTPDMKLDGYAVAYIAGGSTKYFELDSIPPYPEAPEIDEFFSLDGLTLGANGLLVLGIGPRLAYRQILDDSNHAEWDNIWNGGLDTPGKLEHDGSITVMLIRNRPGTTEADPGNPLGLMWGKDVEVDQELLSPAYRTFCSGGTRDGKHCECENDCPGGGTCETMDFCLGGDNDRDACAGAADCPGGTCVSSADEYGDGSLDKGPACVGGVNNGDLCSGSGDCPDGSCQTLHDLRGASTPVDVTDDLEVVDEFSFEGDSGHEYDVDDRHVDAGVCVGGSSNGELCDRNCDCDGGACVPGSLDGLPRRRVHALDDPQGFNPDALSRVDYRTKGPGWTPAPGAYGEMPSGNNWQDTATEQWIRGESVRHDCGEGASPCFYYINDHNDNPDAIQPYMTQVPLWLDDSTPPDYSFTLDSYQIMAGRINELAVPYIPGDTDRDGDCDADDISKLAAVFGDDDWIFSNSFAASPEGDEADPATQTRPWDVDLTGDNGIEASDLQWVLNFQGDATGRIVGVRYDSTTRTPLGSGVPLNPSPTDAVPSPGNNTVGCAVTAGYTVLSSRTLSTLKVGDRVELIVSGEVTGGAITTAGQENGIMQFIHDVTMSMGGVMKVAGVEPLGVFATTRGDIQTPAGLGGDLGMSTINGYTTSFTQGIAGAVQLYKVTLKAAGLGTTDVLVGPAAQAKFAASAPAGLKVGHSNNHGNPASAVYPVSQTVTVTSTVLFDRDGDGDVDAADLGELYDCATGPALGPVDPGCTDWDRDSDDDVDSADFGIVQKCVTGSGGTPDQDCDQ